MITSRWQVRFTPAELPSPSKPLPFVTELPDDWEGWLRRAEVVPGTPFLLSPLLEYDVVLNGFFHSAGMLASAWNTQAGYARNLAAFLTFLWSARPTMRPSSLVSTMPAKRWSKVSASMTATVSWTAPSSRGSRTRP